MAETTKVQWADGTWSPQIGCAKVHAGCQNCYAEQYGRRFGVKWGPGEKRRRTSAAYWKKPLAWARASAKEGKRIRVFPSLCDPLDPEMPADVFSDWMDVIRRTAAVKAPGGPVFGRGFVLREAILHGAAGIDWLLLTKRPERWRCIPEDVRPLVWLGTSVSDQATADEWVPRLLAAEGFALRFLSIEPLVGPVDIERWLWMSGPSSAGPFVDGLGRARGGGGCGGQTVTSRPTGDISWVICGGESGHNARPCEGDWVRSILAQCRFAGVRAFFKQGGAKFSDPKNGIAGRDLQVPAEAVALISRRLKDSHGADLSELPPEFNVREFPEVRHDG